MAADGVVHLRGYRKFVLWEKAAFEGAEHAAKFRKLGEVVTDSPRRTCRCV